MNALELDPIIDGDVVLRALRRSDLRLTLSWRNDDLSRRWFYDEGVIDWASHVSWFDDYLSRSDDHIFILETGGEPVAQVSLYRVTRTQAEFGRLLVDPRAREKGFGHLASRLCLRVADDQLGLDAVHLEVKEGNVAAIRIYEALGFQIVEVGATAPASVAMLRRRPAPPDGPISAKART